jgi:BlaI family penicillinase repressor
MRSKTKPLSELEHAIMEILWRRRTATADEIREDLAPTRDLKDSTVRTILRRLEVKGHAKHRVVGRTYVYSGVEAQQNFAVRAVRQIIDRFCSGSVEQLLVGMVDNEILDGKELRRLADKVDREAKRRSIK